MDGKRDILDAIRDFVETPRDQNIRDRVAKFFSKVASKGDVSETPIFEKPIDNYSADRVIEFFAPVGYRQLFEEEIVFLMSEGISYQDIMQMPVYLRKILINRKLGRAKVSENTFEDSALFEQAQRARSAINVSELVGE